MDAEKLLAAESTVALAGAVAGDMLRQKDRTLPRPRRILSVFLFYGTLSLISGFGQGPARVAAMAGAVVALAALVLGTAGTAIVGLLARGTGLVAQQGGAEPAGAPEVIAYNVPPYQR